MKKSRIANGVFWIEEPEADLRMLCGAPADVVKHLMRGGYITGAEKNGVVFETGPNAILLSDVSIQNGEFSNLAEFPVLQMLYRQGLIIPNHPNNTGRKPLIIGAEDQVQAQRDYIYRGNYGLVSTEELVAAGVPKKRAAELMRIKTHFAFGRIRDPEELIDFRIVRNEPVEVFPGVDIERVAINTYRISTQTDYVEVSLTIDRNSSYEPPYQLGQNKIKSEYFSIVHTGEGDGWDIHRPCMASIVVFQGRVYLIDAGPSVHHTLNALGISVNEIAGIFHTHAHDDHFAGLTSLVRADHKLAYYATPMVRASVMKKLSALMSFPEEQFKKFFDTHDLVEGEWNMIDGLEVRPVYSPHPVETTIMFFRALWENDYKTYAHFADITSFEVLDTVMTGKNDVSRKLKDEIVANYLTPVDVKKLDIGGGMIHGRAEDFRDDTSGRIVLSHKATALTLAEKEIGANSSFGMRDVLIPTSVGAVALSGLEILQKHFPMVPDHELLMLSNCPARTHSVGTILVKKGEVNRSVLLLLNGLADVIDTERGVNNTMTAGAFLGEMSGLLAQESPRTYRAASFVNVLEIPAGMFLEFIERNGMGDLMGRFLEAKHFLEGTELLGDRIAGDKLTNIVQTVTERTIKRGERLKVTNQLLFVVDGAVSVVCGEKEIEEAGPFDVIGEECVLNLDQCNHTFRATRATRVYAIPVAELADIPIVRWKLLEHFNRRRRLCNAIYQA